jgi:hypothetical protein
MRVNGAQKSRVYYREWRRKFTGFTDKAIQQMTKSEAIVYLMLLRDTKPDGTARAGLADLADRGAMNRKTVIRAMRSLIRHGDVRIVRKGVPGKPTLYTVFQSEVLKLLNPQAELWCSGATDLVSSCPQNGDTA